MATTNNNKDNSKKRGTSEKRYSKEQLEARKDTIRAIKDFYGGDVDPKVINSIVANIEVESAFKKDNLKEKSYSWGNLQENPNLKTARKNLAKWGGTQEDYEKLSNDEKLSVMYWGDKEHTSTAGGRGAIQLTSANYGGNDKTDEDLRRAAEELELDVNSIHDDFYNSTLATLKVYENRGKDFRDYADSPMTLRKEVINPLEVLDPENKGDASKLNTLSYYDTDEDLYGVTEEDRIVSKNTVSVNPDAIANNPDLDDAQKEELMRINESQGLEQSTADRVQQNRSLMQELGYIGSINNMNGIVDEDSKKKDAKVQGQDVVKPSGHQESLFAVTGMDQLLKGQDQPFNDGGNLNVLTEYNAGGSHEQNPQGGVPVGMNAQGGRNLVEQGETRHGDYIFSNHYKLSEEDAERFNLDPKMAGKSMSDISKQINDEIERRPYDNLTKKTANGNLNKLMLAQESLRAMDQASSSGEGQDASHNLGGMMGGGGMQGNMMQGGINMAGQMGQGMQTNNPNTTIPAWESAKDAAAQTNPYMAAARAAEQMTKGIGSAIGGQEGENIATGVADPFSAQVGVLKHEDATGWEKAASVGVPVLSGFMMNKAEGRAEAKERRKQSYIDNNKFSSTFEKGGLLDSHFKHGGPHDPPASGGAKPWFLSEPMYGNVEFPDSGPIDPALKSKYSAPLTGEDEVGPKQYNAMDNWIREAGLLNGPAYGSEPAWNGNNALAKLNQNLDQAGAPQPVNDGNYYNNDPDGLLSGRAQAKKQHDYLTMIDNNVLKGHETGLLGEEAERAGQAPQDYTKWLDAQKKLNEHESYAQSLEDNEVVGNVNLSQYLNENGASSSTDAKGSQGSKGSKGSLRGPGGLEALRYAGVAGNLAQYLTAPDAEVERYDRLDNRYQPDYVDERSLENRVANSAANTRRALTDTYGGSAAGVRAGLLASQINESRALSDARMRAEEQNRGENARGQHFNFGVDRINQNISMNESIANTQNRAAAEDYKRALMQTILSDATDIGGEAYDRRILENVTGYGVDGRRPGRFSQFNPQTGENEDTGLYNVVSSFLNRRNR